jgi:hypothetical protein
MKTAIGLALAAVALSAPAEASWKCPNMYGTGTGPFGSQRAAVQRAREEEAAAQVQRAAELARLEVQREATRTQAIAAAKIAAEVSPDNICREPKVAGRVLDDFNSMDWPDGRRAVDIEHLVTIANNGENYVSCHGVWDLKDGRQIEGTLTLKTNVAGNPIAQWQQGGWEPTPTYSSGCIPLSRAHARASLLSPPALYQPDCDTPKPGYPGGALKMGSRRPKRSSVGTSTTLSVA